MFSTEHDMAKGSIQRIWIEEDLKKVNRSKTPWITLNGHRPMYNSEMYPGDFEVSENFK